MRLCDGIPLRDKISKKGENNENEGQPGRNNPLKIKGLEFS